MFHQTPQPLSSLVIIPVTGLLTPQLARKRETVLPCMFTTVILSILHVEIQVVVCSFPDFYSVLSRPCQNMKCRCAPHGTSPYKTPAYETVPSRTYKPSDVI